VLAICLFCILFLFGCNSPINTSALKPLAKTDIDMVADTSLMEMNRLMEELLVKLYKRNPNELRKRRGMTIDQRKDMIFDLPGRLFFPEIDKQQGTNALNLAFDKNFKGDRVFALMCGLAGVVRSSYNWQSEQFMFDSLDEEALFKSARNIEILAWRLSNTRDDNGKLLLLTNSQSGEEENLSYERLFGKMIATQDMMSFIIAGKWERGISSVLKQAVFLPMGL
jgi:hypothetical protein